MKQVRGALVFAIALLVRLGAAILARSFSGQAHAAQSAPALLSAMTLKEAIAGRTITHRGIRRSAEASRAFAERYLSAIAEVATEQGIWCSAEQVLPHEMSAQVFESLSALEAPEDQPAGSAVAAELAAIVPCPSH